MHRITVSLPDDLAEMIAREAARRRTSVSELVRRAVADNLGTDANGPKRLPFVALGRSGKQHTARDAEEIMAREWADVRDR